MGCVQRPCLVSVYFPSLAATALALPSARRSAVTVFTKGRVQSIRRPEAACTPVCYTRTASFATSLTINHNASTVTPTAAARLSRATAFLIVE